MIWFLVKMIYRLATLAVLAMVCYFIYAAVTGQKIGAAELPAQNTESLGINK